MTLSTSGPTHPGKELRDSALRQLDGAARALSLDPGMHKFLSSRSARSSCRRRSCSVRRVASAIEKRGIFP